MLDMLSNVLDLIRNLIWVISNTAHMIDSINFNETVFHDYLGYARYVMGDPLYSLFMTTILISIGVTLWTYLLKGITLLRSLLP